MADNIVIVGAKRTAMGGFMGGLSDVAATDLGAVAIKAALEQSGSVRCRQDSDFA